MKTNQTVLLVITALAGTLSAYSAPTDGLRQPFTVRFEGEGAIPQTIYSVSSIPLPDEQPATLANTFVQTDGAGKLTGVSQLTLEFLQGTNVVGSGEFVLDITGSISTSGNKPKVNMKLAGMGFTTDGNTNIAEAKLSIKFKGLLGTNELDEVNFVGDWRGSIKQSVPAINNGNKVKYSEDDDPATLIIAESDARDLAIDGEVLRIDDKLYPAGIAIGDVPVNGSGKVQTDGDWKFEVKGVNWGKGMTIRLNGTSTTHTNVLFTGFIERAKGKAMGQKLIAENGVLTFGEEEPPAEQ